MGKNTKKKFRNRNSITPASRVCKSLEAGKVHIFNLPADIAKPVRSVTIAESKEHARELRRSSIQKAVKTLTGRFF